MSKTHGIFTPRNHQEYAEKYWGGGEQERKMSRAQHEDVILKTRKWRGLDPEFERFRAANLLAAAGALGGSGSRLGSTREEALRFLRRYLTKAHLVEIGETIEDYDLSVPHPPYEFGPGWTEEDRRLSRERNRASIETFEAWKAERHRHWYYRLTDWLPSRERVMYTLSIARRWRWIRYAI
jgi:hypothetical protein